MWYLHDWNVRDIVDKSSAILLIVSFLSRWNKGSSFWHLCRRWWYRVLSLQHTRAIGDGGIVSLTIFCFQFSTNKISTPDCTETFSSLNCTWYILLLFYYTRISSLSYIIIVLFLFSHWKHGIVELTPISSLVASWFVITTNCSAIGGFVSLTIFCFRCSN